MTHASRLPNEARNAIGDAVSPQCGGNAPPRCWWRWEDLRTAILREHRDVEEVAVVGVASVRWGETPVAFIVPRPGAAIDAVALREWANARLGKLQRLHAIEEIASLPRSPIGKVLKRELRDAYDNSRKRG